MRVYLRSHHREELLQPNMQFLKLAYFREEIPFKPQVFPRCQNAEVCLQRLLRYFLLRIVVYMVRLFICGAHNIVIRRKRRQTQGLISQPFQCWGLCMVQWHAQAFFADKANWISAKRKFAWPLQSFISDYPMAENCNLFYCLKAAWITGYQLFPS